MLVGAGVGEDTGSCPDVGPGVGPGVGVGAGAGVGAGVSAGILLMTASSARFAYAMPHPSTAHASQVPDEVHLPSWRSPMTHGVSAGANSQVLESGWESTPRK